jgi:aminoglycoside 2'-N-acetyltransferase I
MARVAGSPAGTTLETGRAAQLAAGTLRAARALLDDVFSPEMTDHDWDHCLGGEHVLLWEGRQLVAHAAVVERRLTIGARPLRAGYVEGVAVRADRQRRGYGAAVMSPVETTIAREYALGALGSTEVGVAFYVARGWRAWQGPTWARVPNGLMRTPDEDGWIYVLESDESFDFSETLTCEWRPGDVW